MVLKNPSIIKHFRVFDCKIYVLNTKDQLKKFMVKDNENILIGYSNSSKTYRVYNKKKIHLEESLNVIFKENLSSSSTQTIDDKGRDII